jgi:hypothetical protein
VAQTPERFHLNRYPRFMAGQALAGAVGHVAEFLDGLLHTDPGRFADPALAVHDSRDRRGGDGGAAGDIVESDHGGSIGGVAMFGTSQDVRVLSDPGGLTLTLGTGSVKAGYRGAGSARGAGRWDLCFWLRA